MKQFPQYRAGLAAPAIAVIDTNAVLDAWWFRDPQAAGLAAAVASGYLSWAASAAMRAELQEVLTRLPFVSQPSKCEHTLSVFDSRALLFDQPTTLVPLICMDPDDQCFLDLALACRAGWLFTRDRALLDLAPRAAGHGCRIVPPSAWPQAALAATSAADPGP